jgi:hypothetical protein
VIGDSECYYKFKCKIKNTTVINLINFNLNSKTREKYGVMYQNLLQINFDRPSREF